MASVSISRDGQLLAERINESQYEHASFVQPAIEELLNEIGCSIEEMHAVSVVNGPGSYTGLRVGLASAKGICFAKNIPLICINTLAWMATECTFGPDEFVCPMIDARRDEVFTALYDRQGKILLEPQAMVLDATSFSRWLDAAVVHFIGDGAVKWKNQINHPHAQFPVVHFTAKHLATLSFDYFVTGRFADLAYAEHFYTKEFYSTQRK